MDSTVPNLEWYRHKCYKKIIFYFTLLSLFYSTFSLFSHISISLPSASLSLSSYRSLPTMISTHKRSRQAPNSTHLRLSPSCLPLPLLSFFFFFFHQWLRIPVFVWLFMVNFGDWIWFEKWDFNLGLIGFFFFKRNFGGLIVVL